MILTICIILLLTKILKSKNPGISTKDISKQQFAYSKAKVGPLYLDYKKLSSSKEIQNLLIDITIKIQSGMY